MLADPPWVRILYAGGRSHSPAPCPIGFQVREEPTGASRYAAAIKIKLQWIKPWPAARPLHANAPPGGTWKPNLACFRRVGAVQAEALEKGFAQRGCGPLVVPAERFHHANSLLG